MLFGEEDHYARTLIYSARPLLHRGAAALSCDGITGLRSVRLTRLKFLTDATRSRHPHCDTWESTDLSARLEDPQSVAALRASPAIVEMTFAVQLAAVRGFRAVSVHMPNRFDFDPRVDDAPVREFLQARGFADYGAGWSLAA